jgi:hypothetical protein
METERNDKKVREISLLEFVVVCSYHLRAIILATSGRELSPVADIQNTSMRHKRKEVREK